MQSEQQPPLTEFMRQLIEDDPGSLSDTFFDGKLTQENEESILTILNELSEFREYDVKQLPRNLPKEKLILGKMDEYKVAFILDDAQLSTFEKEVQSRYVRYEPKWHHDHPLSHMYTEISEQDVIKSFKGAKFIDLHGNSSRNVGYKVNGVCYKGVFRPKDYLRIMNNKPTDKEFVSYERVMQDNPGVKKVLATHALYYMSIENIASIVVNEGVSLNAIVHRHNKLSGMINGECEYAVDGDGYVTQWTPLGESYTHPTLEPYFHTYEAMTSKGVITWTASKLYGDTYLLKFIHCPGYKGKVGNIVLPTPEKEPEPKVTFVSKEYKMLNFFGYKWIQHVTNKDIVLEDVEYFDELRSYVAMRPRDQQTLRDLTHYARRLTDKKDLFAKHGDSYHKISPDIQPWYINLAFYADIEDEIAALLNARRQYQGLAELHKKLITDLSYKDTTMCDSVTKAVHSTKIMSSVVKNSIVSTGMAVCPTSLPFKPLTPMGDRSARMGSNSPFHKFQHLAEPG